MPQTNQRARARRPSVLKARSLAFQESDAIQWIIRVNGERVPVAYASGRGHFWLADLSEQCEECGADLMQAAWPRDHRDPVRCECGAVYYMEAE